MSLKEIAVTDLSLNPMKMFGEVWPLLTAGNKERGYNTMTIAWGHIGAVWNMPGRTVGRGIPTIVVYVRPQRYTKVFIDREELFTVSVLDPGKYRKALAYLGTHSGRDEDKIAKMGLTPCFIDGTTCFEEASLVFVCRKLYHTPILENAFVDKEIVTTCFSKKDFSELYVGEIKKVLKA